MRVDKDELYPYYYLTEDYGVEVVLTSDELAYVERVGRQFGEMQDFLHEKFTAS